jgi:mono/diheme cytochrome c family protein
MKNLLQGANMKFTVLTTICATLLTGTATRAAENGTALYKGKCSGCHGANGEGKPAMKAPAVKGTSLSEEQITERLVNGMPAGKGPHKKGIAGLTEVQAKTIAAYVKTL